MRNCASPIGAVELLLIHYRENHWFAYSTFKDFFIECVDPFRNNNSQCSPTEQPCSQHSDQLQPFLEEQERTSTILHKHHLVLDLFACLFVFNWLITLHSAWFSHCHWLRSRQMNFNLCKNGTVSAGKVSLTWNTLAGNSYREFYMLETHLWKVDS